MYQMVHVSVIYDFYIYFKIEQKSTPTRRLLLGLLGLLLALGLALLGGLGGGLGLHLHDLDDDLLLLDEEGSGDSALEGISADATAVGTVDGLASAGGSAWLKVGGASGLDSLQLLAGVTALGDDASLSGVEENELATGRLADDTLVGAGVPCQSASVLDSLNHGGKEVRTGVYFCKFD